MAVTMFRVMGLYSDMFHARYSTVAPSVSTVAVSQLNCGGPSSQQDIELYMPMRRHATAAATCADMNGGNQDNLVHDAKCSPIAVL